MCILYQCTKILVRSTRITDTMYNASGRVVLNIETRAEGKSCIFDTTRGRKCCK